MSYKYLPPNKDNKLFSPVGILNLFKKAVEDEGGNIQAVFDKPDKYKTLIELWYASPLAVAIFKWRGDKFFIYPADNPDVHFVKIDEQKRQEGFSVEIMTLFEFGQTEFNEDYVNLAQSVWDKKGQKDYDRSELLLVSRLVGQLNVDKLADEINKFKWVFFRIWLSVYNAEKRTWTLFEISPYLGQNSIGQITVGLTDLPY
jgi:hypothetical protein